MNLKNEAWEPKEQRNIVISIAIYALDREIDKVVYDLYELTEDEIKVVEGG